MSVVNDKYWTEVSRFIKKNKKTNLPVFANHEFSEFGIDVITDIDKEKDLNKIEFFVIHKGIPEEVDFVEKIKTLFHPVFANEVFVVFSDNLKIKKIDDSNHFRAFLEKYKNLGSRIIKDINKTETRPAVYLGNNRILTRTIYGHKIIVDSRDISLAPHILIDGFWEKWITNVFLDLLEEGMTVLDIGANIGYYSLLAADKIGTKGRLVCFEANPELSDVVFYNLQINGFGTNSEVISKAVYSEDSKLTFNVYEKYLGSSSLWGNDAHAEIYHDKIKKIIVDGIALDSHFPAATKIDFIKIDAEGAEPYILKGAKRVLNDNPNVIVMMEFAPAIINVAYGSVEFFYKEIRSLGFDIFRIEHNSKLHKLTLSEAIQTPHCDVILKK
jgi:FkbM family methyltransferase